MLTSRSGPPDQLRNGVLVLTGYGIQLRMERGHLSYTAGVADERWRGRLPRVCPELRRVVVVGHSGTVSLDALNWMQETGTAFVQLGYDGELISSTAPDERSHAELIRAQALAQVDGGALEISRQLVAAKIQGQLTVLSRLASSDAAQESLAQLMEAAKSASSGSDLLTIEAKAANDYWSVWQPIATKFRDSDRDKVPEHWLSFGFRKSRLSKNAQHAVTPANAMLNYLYGMLRAEARLATATMGMEPGLSVYHATKRWRDSFSYDLMEPIRPLVDDYLLDVLEDRTFKKSDFFETSKGVVRCMPTVSKLLSQTAPRWADAVAPLVERVAEQLMAWADGGKRGSLTRRNGNTSDGSLVPTRLTKDNYKPGSKIRRKQKKSAYDAWKANQEWTERDDEVLADIDYEAEILPGLQHIVIRRIAEATGLSMSYAAAIRNGREVPHRRHWPALFELAQEEDPERELREKFEGVDFREDILAKLPDLTHREIAEAVGLSRPYVSDILRGEKEPTLRHWASFRELVGLGR